MDNIDYKELLKKYIDHVGCEEGTTFISRLNSSFNEDAPKFTPEEVEVLKKLSEGNNCNN